MRRLPRILAPLASLELTILILAGLMITVFLCTMDQVHLGTHWAVEKDMRSAVIYWTSHDGQWRIPVFPGGGILGGLLILNLSLTLWSRFVFTRQKVGLWLVHLGLIVLVAGEFVTAFFQVETQMPLEEGQSSNYSESSRSAELVIIETTHPDYDEVTAIPQSILSREGDVSCTNLPFVVRIAAFYRNADLIMLDDGMSPAPVTQGIGLRVAARPLPRSTKDDEPDTTTVYAELLSGGTSLGVWLLSLGLGAPQTIATEGGRSFSLQLRPRRDYLPYTLILEDFKHDVYAGTDIPRNYSSDLRLLHADAGENRHVKISMNHPLRYLGTTFFQSGFGKGDTMSILQVVRNPGWRMPYVAFVMMSVGLMMHFVMSFARSRERTQQDRSG